jgi:hypothetical protein
MRTLSVVLLLTALASAGCLDTDATPGSGDAATDPDEDSLVMAADGTFRIETLALATFTEHVVDVAVDFTGDLYEPTLEVSDTGVIYVTGHTILVDTTGAPVFASHDDGATWAQLPFLGPLAMPEPVHGATPPPSDEIFLVAGDDGWLYGVDITLVTYPVNAWSGDGAQLSYHNPNAYDMVQAMQVRAGIGCSSLALNDRPWAAYANGTLLMVNNPGGGPVQLGVMQVPPALPVGGPGVAGVVPPQWNLCASPGGSIPGIPDIREDGLFVVPQVEYGDSPRLIVVVGNKADVMSVEVRPVMDVNHSAASSIINSGQVVFDADGTLYATIMNNTREDADGERHGRFKLAVSLDGAETFSEATFATAGVVQSVYLDGNPYGAGALLAWAIAGEQAGRSDWFVGHLFAGPDGSPVLRNIAQAIDEGAPPSAHVSGAAVGPDGRAYVAGYEGLFPPSPTGHTPLRVWVQQDGPVLPGAVVAE